MTGPAGRPRGRRNNGLDAREFSAVGDLDPRVGEHLLDVLAVAGIAAYLQPSADVNPVTRTTVLPSTPTDRLWVDRDHADEARQLVAKVAAEAAPAQTGDLDVDAAWNDIVASYDAPSTPSWPAIEDATDDPPPRTGLIRADHLNPIGPPMPGPRDHTLAEPSDDDLSGEVDEGYEPPPPPPLPRPSSQAVVGALAIVVGLALFFRPDLLPLSTLAVMVLGVGGVLGGAALLINRLRDGVSGDDDPDDGAVV